MVRKSETLLSILKLQPVVPVLVVEDASTAVPLARALVAGGLRAIEITLRTPAALEAVRLVASEVEGAVAGAGTILDAGQFAEAEDAGASSSSARARRRNCSTPPASPTCRCFRAP